MARGVRTGSRPGARVVADRVVEVVVPGSTANLGPGFDAVGLALGVHDVVRVQAVDASGGAQVRVSGEGAGRVGTGEDNLVVRSVRAVLHRAGAEQPGLRVESRNGVPHGRGVGSSAAGVVAGVVAGCALLERPLEPHDVLDTACALEGHPDNAAASLLGGLTLGWHEAAAAGGPARWRAVRVEPHADLCVLLCLPEVELSTARARAMLPLQVPHADAAHTAGRAALLVEAVTRSPELLLAATDDRLHQAQRAAAMPESWHLLTALRDAGHAAAVSGAGPSVVVLCADAPSSQEAARVAASLGGWRSLRPGVPRTGAAVSVLAPR